MTSGKFLARCGFLIIAWLVLVATFNVFVDPYGLWGSPRIDGFNAMKAAAGTKVRMTKKAAISAQRHVPSLSAIHALRLVSILKAGVGPIYRDRFSTSESLAWDYGASSTTHCSRWSERTFRTLSLR
jgi:hypothetical protein